MSTRWRDRSEHRCGRIGGASGCPAAATDAGCGVWLPALASRRDGNAQARPRRGVMPQRNRLDATAHRPWPWPSRRRALAIAANSASSSRGASRAESAHNVGCTPRCTSSCSSSICERPQWSAIGHIVGGQVLEHGHRGAGELLDIGEVQARAAGWPDLADGACGRIAAESHEQQVVPLLPGRDVPGLRAEARASSSSARDERSAVSGGDEEYERESAGIGHGIGQLGREVDRVG